MIAIYYILFSFILCPVLSCGDIPDIENSQPHSLNPPYLAGISVVQYQCSDRYQLKSPEDSSTMCEAVIAEYNNINTVWSNISNILCIPGLSHISLIFIDNCNQGYIATQATHLKSKTKTGLT